MYRLSSNNFAPVSMGIFGFSVHEKMADSLLNEWPVPGYDRGDWINISQSLLPIYQDAIQNKGYAPYSGSADGQRTLDYCINASGLSSGIVTAYLMQLQQSASEGAIDGKHYNPAIKTAQQAVNPYSVDKLLPSKETIQDTIFKPLDKQITKVLIIGGIGIVIYFLGKELIKNGSKKRLAR